MKATIRISAPQSKLTPGFMHFCKIAYYRNGEVARRTYGAKNEFALDIGFGSIDLKEGQRNIHNEEPIRRLTF